MSLEKGHGRIGKRECWLIPQWAHWSIENNLHWVLDVFFAEDDAYVRMGNAAVVLNMLRKMVLTLLKADSSVKGSLTFKRLRCPWDFSFALSVLRISHS